jgi:hypothetical protein
MSGRLSLRASFKLSPERLHLRRLIIKKVANEEKEQKTLLQQARQKSPKPHAPFFQRTGSGGSKFGVADGLCLLVIKSLIESISAEKVRF